MTLADSMTWVPRFADDSGTGYVAVGPDPPAFTLGLDLGQANDYSALSIVKRVQEGEEEARYELLHLKRWTLGTRYPDIVKDVAGLLQREPLADPPANVALDYTGCGRPVADMFEAAGLNPILVGITGGNAVSQATQREFGVPKRDLASIVAVLLQEGRLKWPAALPEARTLARELQNFRVKVTTAGNDTYGAWREGLHDDLVLAVALACWVGERFAPAKWQFF